MSNRMVRALIVCLATFLGAVLITLLFRIVQECRAYGYSVVECFWRFVEP